MTASVAVALPVADPVPTPSASPTPGAGDCTGSDGFFGGACQSDSIVDKVQEFVADPLGSTTQAVAGSALEEFADAVAKAAGEALKNLTTLWVQVPTPRVARDGTAAWLDSQLLWVTGAVAVLAVIIAGARMAWNARGGGEDARELLRALSVLALVSAANIAVVNTAIQAGDAYSQWILSRVGGEDFGQRLVAMATDVTTAGAGQMGLILVSVLGLILVVAALLQLVLMIARSATLIVLVGLWPLSAAGGNTDWGRQWFKKVTGWVVAFVLYKPAAATIYAVGLRAFGQERGLIGVLTGIMLLCLALFALPALIRLCVPLVGGLADGAKNHALGSAGVLAGALGGAALSRGGGGSGPTGAAPLPPPTTATYADAGPGPTGGPTPAEPAGSGPEPGRGRPPVGAGDPGRPATAGGGSAAGGTTGSGVAAGAASGGALLVAEAAGTAAAQARQVGADVINDSTRGDV